MTCSCRRTCYVVAAVRAHGRAIYRVYNSLSEPVKPRRTVSLFSSQSALNSQYSDVSVCAPSTASSTRTELHTIRVATCFVDSDSGWSHRRTRPPQRGGHSICGGTLGPWGGFSVGSYGSWIRCHVRSSSVVSLRADRCATRRGMPPHPPAPIQRVSTRPLAFGLGHRPGSLPYVHQFFRVNPATTTPREPSLTWQVGLGYAASGQAKCSHRSCSASVWYAARRFRAPFPSSEGRPVRGALP